MKSCIKFISFTLLFLSMFVSKAWAEKVTVITPYLAQPGTQMYVEGFKNEASKKGLDLNIIDTKGDVAEVIKEATKKDIDRRDISVPEIHGVGKYKVQIKLHNEVNAEINLEVTSY